MMVVKSLYQHTDSQEHVDENDNDAKLGSTRSVAGRGRWLGVTHAETLFRVTWTDSPLDPHISK